MKTISMLALCILIPVSSCFGEQAWAPVIKDGTTTVSGGTAGFKITVNIFSRVVSLPANEKEEDKSHSTNCTYTVKPCTEIYKLEVSVNGTQIMVPRSVFSDLGDITNARVVSDVHGAMVLQLTGGDGDEGYYVYVHLSRGKIIERDVYSFAGPKAGPLETTKYYSVEFP